MRTRRLGIGILVLLAFVLSGAARVVAAPSAASASVVCPDFDGDGVDIKDLTAIAGDWHNPGFDPLHDVDKDGDVDVVDLVLAAKQLGNSCFTPATVYGVALGEGNADRETKARQAGAEWYRIIVNWRSIEAVAPSGGTHSYNWGGYDSLIRGLRSRGLHPLVEIRGIPTWALAAGEPPCGQMTSSGLQHYSTFLQEMVERSDGDGVDDMTDSPVVRYWEIGNEVDKDSSAASASAHFGLCYGDHPDKYAQLLARSWDAIKGADDQAQVVFGGLAYEKCCDFLSDPLDQVAGLDFLEGVLKYIEDNKGTRDPKTYFDVMNIHAYGWFVSHYYSPPEVGTKYQIVRNKLATYCPSCGTVPLMNTEGGRQSTDNIVWGHIGTRERQARYVPVFFVRSLAADLEAVFWFATMDFENDGDPDPEGYGLLTVANDAKESYWAYKTVTDELAGYTYDAAKTGSVSWPSSVEGHVFSDGGSGEKWVVFIPPQNEGTTQSMSFPFSKIKVVDYDKFNSTYPGGDGDPAKTQILCGPGSVNVTVSVDPIFVQPNPPDPCP